MESGWESGNDGKRKAHSLTFRLCGASGHSGARIPFQVLRVKVQSSESVPTINLPTVHSPQPTAHNWWCGLAQPARNTQGHSRARPHTLGSRRAYCLVWSGIHVHHYAAMAKQQSHLHVHFSPHLPKSRVTATTFLVLPTPPCRQDHATVPPRSLHYLHSSSEIKIAALTCRDAVTVSLCLWRRSRPRSRSSPDG